MIGIDARILLRLWLDDAPAHNERIDALLAAHAGTPGAVLVTDVVLAEAPWALRSAYAQDRAVQSAAVRSLLEEAAFAFEDRDAIEQAVTLFEQSACGFSDCLVAARHRRLGCEFTATLDPAMRGLPGVRLL
jgi:predicted nucleic-acid-binding protein